MPPVFIIYIHIGIKFILRVNLSWAQYLSPLPYFKNITQTEHWRHLHRESLKINLVHLLRYSLGFIIKVQQLDGDRKTFLLYVFGLDVLAHSVFLRMAEVHICFWPKSVVTVFLQNIFIEEENGLILFVCVVKLAH